MGATNDASALFKRVWGDGTIKAVPDFAKLQKEVKFSQKEKLGDMFVVPVLLQHEHGFTYAVHGDGAFTLNASVAGAVQQAQVRGCMIALRTNLSYEDVYKAVDGGPAAFESAMGLVVDNMQQSFAKRLELTFIYGQQGLATVSGNAAGVLTITDATWAPGMWSGMKDCILEAWTGITATETQHNGDLTVSSVSFSAKTVTVTGTSSAVVAEDVLYFKGARTSTALKECAGLDKIITNTGTLFNISASSYELWRGQSRAINAAISMNGILNAASDATNMGLMDKAKLYLPVRRWNSLNSDQAALRRYGAYSAKFENGAEGITYHSTNGAIEVEAHPFLKEGDGFFLPNLSKNLVRVGATDITFRRPGSSEDIFRELTDSAGLELRAFSDQAVMLRIPAHAVKLTGIQD